MSANPFNSGSIAAPIREAIALVASETGLIFPEGRRGDFELGVKRTMARWKCRDVHDLIDRFHNDRRMFDDLIGELAVYETYFFRDPGQFETVRTRVLPELAARIGAERALRIWSAGCATGEEPYSLAILMEQENLTARARILASDISGAALEAARKACYGNWSFRAVSDGFVSRYFHRRGEMQALDDRLRARVGFAQANLISGQIPASETGAGFDLIFCRNVLIYFDTPTIARVAEQLYGALNDGGWLIAAPSDPPLWPLAPFATEMTENGVLYRRLPSRRAPAQTLETLAAPPAKPRAQRRARAVAVSAATPPQALDAAERLAQARNAAAKGANGRVLILTERLHFEAEACALRLQAFVNLVRPREAEDFASIAVARHPLSVDLRYLRALVQFDAGRLQDAADSAGSALYLDRDFIAGHFLLAAILRKIGDNGGTLRAYRNALAACRDADPETIIPHTDGERAARLAKVAQAAIAALEPAERRI